MTDHVDDFLAETKRILKVVDEILEAWSGEGCYQVPILLLNLATQLGWNDEEIRRNDPVVRLYLKKDHPLWYITRGAKGGIMRRSEHDKKEAAKLAKEKAKAEIKAKLLEKSISLATTNLTVVNTIVDLTDDSVDDTTDDVALSEVVELDSE